MSYAKDLCEVDSVKLSELRQNLVAPTSIFLVRLGGQKLCHEDQEVQPHQELRNPTTLVAVGEGTNQLQSALWPGLFQEAIRRERLSQHEHILQFLRLIQYQKGLPVLYRNLVNRAGLACWRE
jgi:hypothetical protein